MAKALLIAEKPSLMRTIKAVYENHRSAFADEIDFVSQVGHIIGLKMPKEIDAEQYGKWRLDTLPEIYPYQYKINEGKHNLVAQIRKALQSGKYDYIIHAGDPEREGQLLISETLLYLRNTLPVKRFWSNDLTDGAVFNALQNMKDNCEYQSLYDAALTRQHIDYQFGMNITSAASLKLGDLCKLGRVKAPIISIITKRELEIENYVETMWYKPAFTYKDCEFVMDNPFEDSKQAENYLPDAKEAVITDVAEKEHAKKPPKLFKLSTLQMEAHKQLKWSAAKTLAVLQELYEAKVASYPRSACEYISTNEDIGGIAKAVLREYLFSIDTALLVRDPDAVKRDKGYCNDKAIASEGHTAIIPTGKGISENATKDQQDLYEIICRRFLAMFAGAKKTKTIKVKAIPSGTQDVYEYTEMIDLDIGYEWILRPMYTKKEGSGILYQIGDVITPITPFVKEYVSQPPARYNDGSLIQTLDNPAAYEDEDGKTKFKIGTEATRAPIIEECQKNGYFEKDKKGLFHATEKAKTVYQTFKDISLFDIQESGRLEALLEKIRQGEEASDDAETELLSQMTEAIHKMKEIPVENTFSRGSGAKVLGTCPKCKSPVLVGKYGAYCQQKCGMTFQKAYGKDLTESQIKSLLAGRKVLLKGLISKKTGKPYDAYIIPKGIQSYEQNNQTRYSFALGMEFTTNKK